MGSDLRRFLMFQEKICREQVFQPLECPFTPVKCLVNFTAIMEAGPSGIFSC
jgi:hypothetical protein